MTVKHLGADDRDLQPGQQVGEYVVEAKIGEGGFGTVFRAVHPLIGKLVAIKVLARQFSADPEMVSRFVAEARAVNQIRHRNIIDIFGFGTVEDGRHYYVMEFLEGVPLDGHVDAVGRMDLGSALPILRAIARALDAAHGKGIAHRDLKPENVFLARDADGAVFPKLLDFGIAKLLTTDETKSHKTRTGAPIGTPSYMSPEQCRGRDVDHRTDIYAFGIVAYKLLTGRVPFDGADYMEILLKQMSEAAPPPSSIVPELPAGVDEAIAWMMSKEPSARPPNLVTAVRALEQAATDAGIVVKAAPSTDVFASPTAVGDALRTPSTLRTPGGGLGALGSAPTMAAGATPGAMTPVPASMTGPGANGAAAGEPVTPPAARSRWPLFAALGAIVVGVAAFAVVRSGRDKRPGKPATATPPVTAPAPALATHPVTPDAAPPAPRLVTLQVTGTPPGTDVYGPTGPLGVAPGPIQLVRGEQPVLLTFKVDGYVTATRTVVPSADAALALELTAKPTEAPPLAPPPGGKHPGGGKQGPGDKPPGGGKHHRDTVEDPFATGGAR